MENFGYTRMYQDGGSAENQIMQAAQQLVGAAMQGDEQAQQQLLQVAAVGIQAISQQQQQAQVARKGAKLKNGGDCGCKATLKRVGGRVVNVGCNGLPINKLGGNVNNPDQLGSGTVPGTSYKDMLKAFVK